MELFGDHGARRGAGGEGAGALHGVAAAANATFTYILCNLPRLTFREAPCYPPTAHFSFIFRARDLWTGDFAHSVLGGFLKT